MRTFGLIGYPLSHSFSPKYFAEKFANEGLNNCRYEAFPISDIQQLHQLLQSTASLEGLNVTIPYKKQVLPFLSSSNQAVQQMQACNCVSIKNGKLTGYNTDVIGFEKSLLPMLQPWHKQALVLGTGGSSAAVRYVLDQLNISYTLVSRSAGDGTIAYEALNKEVISQHLLIVNATPLGMYPHVHDCPPIPYQFLSNRHYLFDLVYNPAQTLFLAKGAQQGAAVKNGADMLIIQADESWRIWNS